MVCQRIWKIPLLCLGTVETFLKCKVSRISLTIAVLKVVHGRQELVRM